MSSTAENNKRIAKNTLLLYIRMLFSMAVSLYTSRVVLSVLGVIDYGINNVVGGIVIMFAFLNSTMSVSTQRFLSFDIGRNDEQMINKTFNIAFVIHLGLGLVVLLLGETIGLWFLYNKINLPPDRMEAALWIYHFSILSFLFNVTQVPYSACINSHEKMDVYAYFSIVDVVARLIIVFLLQLIDVDKLKLYAVLQFFVSISIQSVYRIYCIRNFPEVKLCRTWDRQRFREMLSFAGWNTIAHFSFMARTQGVNILLNMFFGPTLNAARGIAVTVFTQVSAFVNNFVSAMNPQIVKYFAAGDLLSMHKLITRGSKYSFFLLFFLAFPLLLETNFVLTIWLKNPPEWSVLFCKLILCSALIDSLTSVIAYGTLATGNVKVYQIVMSILFLLVPILTYFLYMFGAPPETCVYLEILAYIVAVVLRPFLLGKNTGYKLSSFAKESLLKDLLVVIFSSPIPYALHSLMENGWLRFFVVCIACVICTGISICFVGFGRSEREKIKVLVEKKFTSKKKI